MATNTFSTLAKEPQTYYDKTLIERLTPQLIYANYGDKKKLPSKNSKTIDFRLFNAYAAATTPLTEGVTPEGKSISMTNVQATVAQYGDFTLMSDVLDLVSYDDTINEVTKVHADQASLTIDDIVRDIICAGTNVFYAAGSSTAEVGATNVMTSTLIKKAVRALRRQNAKTKEGGFYIGIIHPDVAYDIMSDTLWQDVSKYNGGEAIMTGEIGKLGGVRFIESSNAKIKTGAGATSADVYCTMIIGANSYGTIDIDGSIKPQVIVKSLGSAGTADPLDQRSSVGWKALFTAARLNELAMLRIETGATA